MAPYKPALTITSAAGLVLLVWMVSASAAVVAAIVAIAGVCLWLGWEVAGPRGYEHGRTQGHRDMEAQVRTAGELLDRMQTDQARIGEAIEDLATSWEALTPTVPYTCVRDLRALTSIPLAVE